MPPRKPTLENLEAANSDTPPVGIPPNADVTVKFRHTVDPSELSGGAMRYASNELEELAAEEFPEDIPLDPLTEFCSTWANYSGYTVRVSRLPDPAQRRMPGQTYNRICLEIESLGDTPFDPINLQGTLQLINGNSGGVFRLWLIDETGRPIPNAFLARVAIGDPPKQYNPREREHNEQRYFQQQQPAPAKPEPSELELQLQELQRQMLQRAMAKVLDPPIVPTPVPAPVNTMSDEDRLTLLLVNQGGLLPTVIQRLATLAGAPETATAKETLGERALNAGMRIAETNPAIVERISGTLERIVNRLLPPPETKAQAGAQPYQQFQGGRIEQAYPGGPIKRLQQYDQVSAYPAAAHPTGLPEAPDPNDDPDNDEDVMDILDELFTLLTGEETLTAQHPVFVQLAQDYPLKFKGAIMLIASQPLPEIVLWIKEKSPLYASLLNSPVTGPHYHKRLQELQTLCRTPANEQKTKETTAPLPDTGER